MTRHDGNDDVPRLVAQSSLMKLRGMEEGGREGVRCEEGFVAS